LDIFQFKKFKIIQNSASVFKVNTEAVLLSAWASLKPNIRILEIGSGTGVISLGLTQRIDENGTSTITALDIDKNAYELTRKNIEENQTPNIFPIHSSLQDFYNNNQDQHFDLIISNPPYFDTKYKSEKPRNVYAKYTGTLDYNSLITLSEKLLSPDGVIALVVPYDDLNKIKQESNSKGLTIVRQLDLTTIPNKSPLRVLLEIKHLDYSQKCVTESLLIKDSNGMFTEEYKNYTKEYYTIF